MTSHQDGPRLGRTSFRRADWAWQNDAACRGEDLNLFFASEGERGAEREVRDLKAKRICQGCSVRTECLEYAIERPEKFGVWGEQNEDDRHREHRKRVERERRKKDAA